MRRFGKLLVDSARVPAKLLSFAFLSISAAAARAQMPVQYGDTIDSPGLYFLDGNQTGGIGNGITIKSDDVTLLLLRFTLSGSGLDIGILADGYDRVNIVGGRVTGFRFGIAMSDAEDCSVRDSRLDHSGDAGLRLQHVEGSAFLRLNCDSNNAEGVFAVNGYGNRFVSIRSHHNQLDGILIANEVPGLSDDYNRVRLCWLAYNGRNGVRISAAHDNEVTRNECVANELAGIRLELGSIQAAAGQVGTYDNDVHRNWCVFNRDGIVVAEGATDNTLHENIALANSGHDLVDDNSEPPCANLWFLDTFLTKDGDGEDCIF